MLFSLLCEVRSLHVYLGAQCELQSLIGFWLKESNRMCWHAAGSDSEKAFVLFYSFLYLAFLIAELHILLFGFVGFGWFWFLVWFFFFPQSWRKSGVSLERPFLYLSVCSTDPIGNGGTCSESQMPLWQLETGMRLGQITSPTFLTPRRVRWNTRSLRPKWMARRELWSPISSLLLFTALIFTAATMKLTHLGVALPTLSLQEPCLQVCSHNYTALFYFLEREQSQERRTLQKQLEKHWGVIKKLRARKWIGTILCYSSLMSMTGLLCVLSDTYWVCPVIWRKVEVCALSTEIIMRESLSQWYRWDPHYMVG